MVEIVDVIYKVLYIVFFQKCYESEVITGVSRPSTFIQFLLLLTQSTKASVLQCPGILRKIINYT